jgi:iron(III) transport system substrate-binding protein
MIAHHGEDWTEQWLKGVKANLARKPAGDDRLQVKGVYAGECDIAVGNTYYMGVMLQDDKEPEQKEWANSVNIIFPNTGDRGTHVNISGAVVAKYAPHKDNAIKLLEFLASDKGQGRYPLVDAGAVLGRFQTGPDLAQRHRRTSQEGQRARRQGGLRRRAKLMRGRK